ncbi:hypothetical protein D3C72_772810 [compost metagenome]
MTRPGDDPPFPGNLVPGFVLHMVDLRHQDPKYHFYVILNEKPDTDPWLVIAMATSKVDKVKAHMTARKLPPDTAVELQPGEYPHFSQPTIFNCNDVDIFPMATIKGRLEDGLVQYRRCVSPEVLQRLREAALKSPTLEPKYQKLIRPPVQAPSDAPKPADPA